MFRADADRHPRVGSAGSAEVTKSLQTNPAVISRRTAIGGAFGGAMVTLVAGSELATAEERRRKPARLVLLLRGLYQPVVYGPDLGLSRVHLNDGSYSTTKITR